jgi:hypothetical protein
MRSIDQTRRFYNYDLIRLEIYKNSIVCLVKKKCGKFKVVLLDENLDILNEALDILNEAVLNFDFDNLAVNKSYVICFWSMTCIKVFDWYLRDVTNKFEFFYWIGNSAQKGEVHIKQIKLDDSNNLFIHYMAIGGEDPESNGHFMKVVDLMNGRVLCEFRLEFLRRDVDQFEIFSDCLLLFYEKFKRILYFYNWKSLKLEREEEISLTDYLDLIRVDYFNFLFYDKENKKIYKF